VLEPIVDHHERMETYPGGPDNDDAAWISHHRSLTLSNAW
jgi:hypothetical protein